jgi:CarD family transcriptional regulator
MPGFQVGEKVVYPNQGIGVIENISIRCFGGRPEKFYLLRLMCNHMTVMVPFSHVEEIGLRRLSRNGELERVLTFLATGACKSRGDWKNRFKENCEKMRVGGLLQIAEVLKSLLLLQLQKPLSFREKRMLERARQMLITEIALSRGMSEAEAFELVRRALAKASLTLPPPQA